MDLLISAPVILASGSPRRRELLNKLLNDFKIVSPDVDEDACLATLPSETALNTAIAKCEKVFQNHSDSVVIAGDTVVAYQNGNQWVQLAKPIDSEDARRMLTSLSGKQHVVISGVCVMAEGFRESDAVESRITLRDLCADEINSYIATSEPYDKAGGYAVQGMAADFVTNVEGSLSNIIGLPLERLEELLKSVATRLSLTSTRQV